MPNYIQILVISPWTSCLENRDKTTKTNVWFYGAWWLIRESVLQQLCSAIPCKISKVGRMDLDIGLRGYRGRIDELLMPLFTILGFLCLPFSFLVLHFLLLFPIPSLSPFHNLQIYSRKSEDAHNEDVIMFQAPWPRSSTIKGALERLGDFWSMDKLRCARYRARFKML